jgi:hypothetical protein
MVRSSKKDDCRDQLISYIDCPDHMLHSAALPNNLQMC